MADAPCPFCAIVNGEAPATILMHPHYGIAIIEPIGPHAPGHALVIPTRHVPDATTDPPLTGQVFATAARWAQRFGASNLLTSVGADATQTVMHLHVHVVPRGAQDGLPARWPWLPTPAAPVRLDDRDPDEDAAHERARALLAPHMRRLDREGRALRVAHSIGRDACRILVPDHWPDTFDDARCLGMTVTRARVHNGRRLAEPVVTVKPGVLP